MAQTFVLGFSRGDDHRAELIREIPALDACPIQSISAGMRHVLAVVERRLIVWGANDYGQCGPVNESLWSSITFSSARGDEDDVPVPTILSAMQLTHFHKVAAGYWQSMALGVDGRLYAWGAGVLGHGTEVYDIQPAVVEQFELLLQGRGARMVDVACGPFYSLATLEQQQQQQRRRKPTEPTFTSTSTTTTTATDEALPAQPRRRREIYAWGYLPRDQRQIPADPWWKVLRPTMVVEGDDSMEIACAGSHHFTVLLRTASHHHHQHQRLTSYGTMRTELIPMEHYCPLFVDKEPEESEIQSKLSQSPMDTLDFKEGIVRKVAPFPGGNWILAGMRRSVSFHISSSRSLPPSLPSPALPRHPRVDRGRPTLGVPVWYEGTRCDRTRSTGYWLYHADARTVSSPSGRQATATTATATAPGW